MTVSKAVLITGCSTGIGRATAERLHAGGHTVYATARKLDAVKDLADKGMKTLACDVTDEASMVACVEAVIAAEGAVGALVNNAGYGRDGVVEEVPIDEIRRQFETNVFGLTRMCQLVLPGMRDQGAGRIVNVSSMGGKVTFPGGGVYHASKYAVEALSDALRWEVKPFGVKVSLIEPGPILTEFANTYTKEKKTYSGPYAKFNEHLETTVHDAYNKKPMSLFAKGPEAVADAIEKAITSEKPKSRYVVTLAAHALMGARWALPDAGWDLMMDSQFKR